VRTRDYFFVGPDNGVLSWALRNEDVLEMRLLENSRFFRREVSQTFHGRDVFAPVAAHLSKGISPRRLGPGVTDIVRLPWPEPRIEPSGICGEILYIDHFGNAITNIPNTQVPRRKGEADVRLGRRSCPLRAFYQAVQGKPVAVPGSTGLLEIAVNEGNAARALALQTGTPVTLRRAAHNSPSPFRPVNREFKSMKS
jgi:S-adenosylmethionine hydrolase